MTKAKKPAPFKGPTAWEENDEDYPTKRGVCDVCGQRDDLKLAFDRMRYICINDHACLLRWGKQIRERRGELN